MPIRSTLTARLLDRKTNTLLAPLDHLLRLEFTDRWRSFGNGWIEISNVDLAADPTVFARLIAGTASIQIIREWTDELGVAQSEEFSGPILRADARDGKFVVNSFGFESVINEVVGLGSDDTVGRAFDAPSQLDLGVRESLVSVGSAVAGDITTRAQAELNRLLEPGLHVDAGGAPGKAGVIWRLYFADHRWYFARRIIDTEGVTGFDPASGTPVPATTFLTTVLEHDLLAPTVTRRRLDVPAVYVDLTAGNLISQTYRWERLDEAVELASVAGDVGVRSKIDASNRIEYTAQRIRERTAGTAGADSVIVSRDFVRNEWDIRPGDRVTVESYFDPTASNPDLQVSALCTARRVKVKGGKNDRVTVDLGSERLTGGRLLRAVDRRASRGESR